jgi:hypothetical protein
MFPIELLAKITDIALGAIGQEAISRLVPNRRDSSRKFARDLLEFYETLQVYGSDCAALAAILENEHFGDRNHWSYRQNLENANRQADLLVKEPPSLYLYSGHLR